LPSAFAIAPGQGNTPPSPTAARSTPSPAPLASVDAAADATAQNDTLPDETAEPLADVPDSDARASRAGSAARWWPTVLLVLIVVAAVVAIAKLATPSASVSPQSNQPPPPSAPSTPAAPSTPTPIVEAELAVPSDLDVPTDMSVVEVRPGSSLAVVTIDGFEVGSGDIVRSIVRPGVHDLVVEKGSASFRVRVPTTATRRTRVSMEGLWGR
jgi:hypothetical protein